MRLPLLLLCAFLPSLACGQLSCGVATLLDRNWAFSPGDDSAARTPEYDDAGWQRVDLPHDWSIRAQPSAELASCTGYLPGGIGWYRQKLPIPAAGGEKVFLYFEGVYNRSAVYLNGHLLGQRPNGYVSFYYDATPFVRFDQENVIAVRVDHSRSADSRWYTGSGIYRSVFLVRTGPVHLAPWGVFARSAEDSAGAARLMIATEVQNETAADVALTVTHDLLSPTGAAVAATTESLLLRGGASGVASATLTVRNPHHWSVETPDLYRVHTTVTDATGARLDETTTTTGFRSLSYDPNRGFALNGRWMKLKGVCLHHDAGVLGAAVPRAVWRLRLQTLKALGCNAVRMSHNPQAPVLYTLCDELGLLVLDEAFDEWEFPKRKWIKGWNVGEPGLEGSADFFDEWSERDLRDMIRRDRNHPSVFAWSIGNEVDYPNDPYSHPVLDQARINQPMIGQYDPARPAAARLGAIARRLASEVRRLDPSRPVTAALAGVVMSNETEYPGVLDIVGYNYTEDRYALDHGLFPSRVIYGSENGHSIQAWAAVRDIPHIFGQFLWTGIDYLGEAGPWPSRGSSPGLLDLTGAVKPRGHFRAALWSEQPVVYLGTERKPGDDRLSAEAYPVWNYEPGTAVRALCYTNAASARLLLNGQPLGTAKPYDPHTGIISWDLPFEAGTLEVIAFGPDGAETVRTAIHTAGPPAALRAGPADDAPPSTGSVTMIAVHVTDARGIRVFAADHEVTCTVEGPARLLGLENGDMQDMSDQTDAAQRVFRGRLVAYVETTGSAEAVRVRFSAPGLNEAVIALAAQPRTAPENARRPVVPSPAPSSRTGEAETRRN